MIERVSSIVERLALIQRELVSIVDAYSGTGAGRHAVPACDRALVHVHEAQTALQAGLKPPGVPLATEPKTCLECGFTKGSEACREQHPKRGEPGFVDKGIGMRGR